MPQPGQNESSQEARILNPVSINHLNRFRGLLLPRDWSPAIGIPTCKIFLMEVPHPHPRKGVLRSTDAWSADFVFEHNSRAPAQTHAQGSGTLAFSNTAKVQTSILYLSINSSHGILSSFSCANRKPLYQQLRNLLPANNFKRNIEAVALVLCVLLHDD
jgi:hypothetical protein